ncbi:flavin reductase family protein [Nonomuraea sp. NPDC050556]|uniref:flavin reductase family protein n=1 Tax=Nonomuraea sp. NPDC050556 TaxID=3364369 RepID=UPI00379B4BB8
MRNDSIGPDLFRSLAGSLPTGVTVITAMDAARRPVGMTSGAVCGLSRTPPLLLACVGKSSRTLPSILRSGGFCVNVLDGGSAWLSDRFAGTSDDKFDGVPWRPSRNGAPVLTEGVVAHAVCEVFSTVDGGDHLIVVGLVVDGELHDDEGAPLVYHRRRYAAFPGSKSISAHNG